MGKFGFGLWVGLAAGVVLAALWSRDQQWEVELAPEALEQAEIPAAPAESGEDVSPSPRLPGADGNNQ